MRDRKRISISTLLLLSSQEYVLNSPLSFAIVIGLAARLRFETVEAAALNHSQTHSPEAI